MEDLLLLFARSLALIGNIKLHLACVFTAMMFSPVRRSKRYPTIKLLGQALLSIFILFYLLKITVAKVRPDVPLDSLPPLTLYHRLTCDAYHSFPSSHAGLAAVYLMLLPKNRMIWILSFLIPLERVFSVRHDRFDVIIGFVLGSILILGLMKVKEKWRTEQSPIRHSD